MAPQRPACSACGCFPVGAKDGDECLRCSGRMVDPHFLTKEDPVKAAKPNPYDVDEAISILGPDPAMEDRLRRMFGKGDAVAAAWLVRRIVDMRNEEMETRR